MRSLLSGNFQLGSYERNVINKNKNRGGYVIGCAIVHVIIVVSCRGLYWNNETFRHSENCSLSSLNVDVSQI